MQVGKDNPATSVLTLESGHELWRIKFFGQFGRPVLIIQLSLCVRLVIKQSTAQKVIIQGNIDCKQIHIGVQTEHAWL